MSAADRLPLKPDASLSLHSTAPFEEVLKSEGVTKENIFCIIPPSYYYKNTLVFPFSERQKIESTIKFEVQDSLPVSGAEFFTDFLVFDAHQAAGRAADPAEYRAAKGPVGSKVFSFTAPKSAVVALLDSFGSFRDNLKGIIPYDAALFFSAASVIDATAFLCMDIQNDTACIQFILGSSIEHSVFLRRASDEQYRQSLSSHLMLLIKSAGNPPLFLNTRSTANDSFRILNEEVLKGLDLTARNFPSRELGGASVRGVSAGVSSYGRTAGPAAGSNLGPTDMIALIGALLLAGQPQSRKVNLLKEEFRARPRGYIRIKDFVTLAVLLLMLLAVSLSNLFIELGSMRRRNGELKKALSALSTKVFQRPDVQIKEAQSGLENMRKGIRQIEASIDRRSSGVEILRELSSYLPNDVVLDFTDIIIEKEHIKFTGKARTFADIDRIKEALSTSEYFSEVAVSNTGTTGSTEGFAVTFLFDIRVKPPAEEAKGNASSGKK